MTTLAHGSPLGGPRHGGVAARRAVVRWAGRMFRREWRQQLLVVTLLTVAVTAAIGSITIASNAVPADDGDFGSANLVLTFDGSDPQTAPDGARRRQEIVWIDRGHRPPLRARPRGRREGGLPVTSPRRRLRRRPARTPPRQLPDRLRPGRRHQRGCRLSAIADRIDPGARRATTDGRGNRREPEQAERRVRSHLALVRAPGQGHRARRGERCVARLVLSLPGRRPQLGLRGLHGTWKRRQQRGGDARDLLRGHRLPPAGVAGCGGRVRSRRAATAPAARHARGRRRDAEAPPPRARDERCRRRGDRRSHRDGRWPRALGRLRTNARVRGRPSHRPSQPSLGADHDGCPPHGRGGDRRRLVARANGLPTSRHARALGTTAHAEARTPLGDRGRGVDRGRH